MHVSLPKETVLIRCAYPSRPSALGARLAQPPDLQHGAFRSEAAGGGDGADGAADLFVVDMGGLAAFVADQEDAIVLAPWMGVGEISVGAFHPQREIVRHEQVEDAID